jgi:hypothetical protein
MMISPFLSNCFMFFLESNLPKAARSASVEFRTLRMQTVASLRYVFTMPDPRDRDRARVPRTRQKLMRKHRESGRMMLAIQV